MDSKNYISIILILKYIPTHKIIKKSRNRYFFLLLVICFNIINFIKYQNLNILGCLRIPVGFGDLLLGLGLNEGLDFRILPSDGIYKKFYFYYIVLLSVFTHG